MKDARPVLLIWLLLAAVQLSLLLRAATGGPAGTTFVGTFYYVDDTLNYLSSVEQAQRGALLFKSKLVSPARPASLLNLEWLAVGWLAALLGGRAMVAFRVFGLLALAGLVAVAELWLLRSGLPASRRLPGLLLVFGGGGLGGLLYALGWLPGERAFDLRTGAYPFVEAIANPHFVAGTTLLASALAAFAADRPRLGAALGVVLGLVRPYDAVLLAVVEGASVLLLDGALRALRRLAWLLPLLPVIAYDCWLFLASPDFRVFSSRLFGARPPSPAELLIAIAPAALLASTAVPVWRSGGRGVRAHLLRLAAWAAFALLFVLLRPASFASQFLVGIGFPLLALAAVGLGRLRRGILELTIPLAASTAAVVVRLAVLATPATHPPVERWRAAVALRAVCRPGELVLAPADIGLYVGALTPCWPFVSHPAAPGYSERVRMVQAFYDPLAPPEERARLLASLCPAHLILPSGLPPGWLGPAASYEPRLQVSAPRGGLTVWSRAAAAPCSAALGSPSASS